MGGDSPPGRFSSATAKVGENIDHSLGDEESNQGQSERGHAKSGIESQINPGHQIKESNNALSKHTTNAFASKNVNELHGAAEDQ